MKITIFGIGYVGLISGVCLSEMGHNVLCIDIDLEKINNLNKGILDIYDKGLLKLFHKNKKKGNLFFGSDLNKGMKYGDVIISTVGEVAKNKKTCIENLEYISYLFGRNLDRYKLFINKSTVPVGSLEKCKNIIKKENIGKIGFDIVSNPEFLSEGEGIRNFMNPDRIICGVENDKSKYIIKKIYNSLLKKGTTIFFTDIKSSELIKYASNIFLATKISLINEISNYGEIVGANIKDVSYGVGLDSRIGKSFLKAGCGYGGSCLSKDILSLIDDGLNNNFEFKIIKEVENVNNNQILMVIKKLSKHLYIKGKTVTILGISYKEGVHDIRMSPSILIINKLLSLGVRRINIYDPLFINESLLFSEDDSCIFYDSYLNALKSTDSVIVMTECKEFINIDYKNIGDLMNNKIVIDSRNIYNKKKLINLGFIYEGFGV